MFGFFNRGKNRYDGEEEMKKQLGDMKALTDKLISLRSPFITMDPVRFNNRLILGVDTSRNIRHGVRSDDNWQTFMISLNRDALAFTKETLKVFIGEVSFDGGQNRPKGRDIDPGLALLKLFRGYEKEESWNLIGVPDEYLLPEQKDMYIKVKYFIDAFIMSRLITKVFLNFGLGELEQYRGCAGNAEKSCIPLWPLEPDLLDQFIEMTTEDFAADAFGFMLLNDYVRDRIKDLRFSQVALELYFIIFGLLEKWMIRVGSYAPPGQMMHVRLNMFRRAVLGGDVEKRGNLGTLFEEVSEDYFEKALVYAAKDNR